MPIYRDGIFDVVGNTCCGHLPGFIPSVSLFLLPPKKSWKVCEANWHFKRLIQFVMPASCDVSVTCSAPLRQVLSRHPAMYPGGLGIYQDQTPLYINCTEVTHIYTNGSYQLVYQNCTPVFVHTKQVCYYLHL